MKIQVPYGKGIEVCEVPDRLHVTTKVPCYGAAVKSGELEIKHALDNLIGIVPVAKFHSAATVAIALSDITRPVPLQILLPQLLNKLNTWGVKDEKIIAIVGGGMHRPATTEDLQVMLGEKLCRRIRVIPHDATDDGQLLYIGLSSAGTPIYVNKVFFQADVRIVTGLIDPHQFMGFTAGVKGVVIGLGGKETIEKNHCRLFHDEADLGLLKNNPVRQDLEQIGSQIGVDMIVNVVLDDKKQILKAVAGHAVDAHRVGVDFARAVFGVPASEDSIVVASPGGFPKDINVYQAQKALTPAGRMVKKGGIIILVAECLEGLGEHRFEEELRKYTSPQEIIDQFPKQPFKVGAHKAYLWARTLVRAETIIVSRKLSQDWEKLLMVRIMPTLQEAFDYALIRIPGTKQVTVLPAGSSTIPVFTE